LDLGMGGVATAGRQSRREWVWDSAWWAGVILLLAFCGCGPERGDQPLAVGMELSYPPFEMKDERGNPAGVSVDLAKALGAALGRDVRIEDIAFDGLIPALKTGRIELIVSSITRTHEREQSIDFSEPYLATGLCLLVAKDSPVSSISNLDQRGRKVAVKKGTTGHAYSVANIREADLLVLDKEAAAVLEVVQARADAFIYDQMSVFQHWQRNPSTTRALLEPFQKEYWAIGVRKGNDRLRGQVNQFLVEYREKGGFERLGTRWLGEQKEAFARMGLDFYF
jgi:polar amino acid transport system substrate-binding protein